MYARISSRGRDRHQRLYRPSEDSLAPSVRYLKSERRGFPAPWYSTGTGGVLASPLPSLLRAIPAIRACRTDFVDQPFIHSVPPSTTSNAAGRDLQARGKGERGDLRPGLGVSRLSLPFDLAYSYVRRSL